MSARLVAVGELAGHEAARIENQVGPLQHLPASHGYQVGVARSGPHNLDVALAQMTAVDGQCGGEVLSFHFFNHQLTVLRAEDGGSLTDAGRTHVGSYHVAGVGHLDRSQLFGGEEVYLFAFFSQLVNERLVGLHVDGAIVVGAWQQATVGKGLVYLVVDAVVVVGVMSKSEANDTHHRYEMQVEHVLRGMADEG